MTCYVRCDGDDVLENNGVMLLHHPHSTAWWMAESAASGEKYCLRRTRLFIWFTVSTVQQCHHHCDVLWRSPSSTAHVMGVKNCVQTAKLCCNSAPN